MTDSEELDALFDAVNGQRAVSRWASHHSSGRSIPNTLVQDMRPNEKIKYKRKLDPVKEWNKVKKVWGGDVAAWQRYSGFKLPDDYVD